ncbi:MAG: glutamine synthetase type III, partial [Proteobacteria bacterium]|nr:glutamine synthetase type III [Pseudomonadota bacterium]
ISIFLGELLSNIFTDIQKGVAGQATESQIINLGVSHIPDISKDYTDRNRTSPFAFTGNKFEFRAVGASANVSVPLAILNAAVSESFRDATQDLKNLLTKKSGSRDEAVMELIRNYAQETETIRFEGNNYSVEWQKEAKKRGLPVLATTPEAVMVLNRPEATEFLVKTQVLSRSEIQSRFHIAVERYNKTIHIELMTLLDMVQGFVIPAMESQLRDSLDLVNRLATTEGQKAQSKRVSEIEKTYTHILETLQKLGGLLEEGKGLSSEERLMDLLATKALPLSAHLRTACDSAESLLGDKYWPIPKYREMLFSNALS